MLVVLLASKVGLRLERALFILTFLVFLSQRLLLLDPFDVLRSFDDRSVWGDTRGNCIDFRLESKVLVDLLFDHFIFNLLFDSFLVVKTIDGFILCLTATGRVSRADDFTHHIDLGLELEDSFLGVLVSQRCSLLTLSLDELGLSGLEVFVITLV